MSGNYLLDTNIVIAYFNHEQTIRDRLPTITAFVPSIVIGELYYGAFKSSQRAANTAQIHAFVHLNTVLVCDEHTAEQYGHVKHQLKTIGRPIPENDIWIAALAIQHNLTLTTRDQHFAHVPGLQTERW